MQSASEFIASSLPRFLRSCDITELDSLAEKKETKCPSVLPWLVTALGKNEPSDSVCDAIDSLVDNDVAMDTFDLKPLLCHSDFIVSKYALALIPNSIDGEEALDLAKERAAAETDSPFSRELERLTNLLQRHSDPNGKNAGSGA